ncbi:MAG: LysR substrate-binding domain-containing protein [Steroidobacteraceae bacterium]
MNLRDLRYLVALADTKHFGKAAVRCHVSQPTLSAQLKKLEEYLGVELIERQPRRVTLTDMGEQVVAHARHIVNESDDLLALARSQRDPLSGSLKLALIPTIGPYLLPLIARQLRKQLPKLKFMLYEYQTEPLLQSLRAGEIDMGVLALPVHADGVETCQLYEEEFMVALPKDHRLASKASIKLTDLTGDSMLLLDDGHCMRDQALDICGHADLDEDQDYRATSLETLRQMVAAGMGVTLLPKLSTNGPFGMEKRVLIKPFPKPAPTRTVGAVWRKSSTRNATIKAVCEVIAECMGERK